MQYSPSGNITQKIQNGTSSINGSNINIYSSYNYTYNSIQPHAVEQINYGVINFSWDANGNLLNVNNPEQSFNRTHCWDEENRLKIVKDTNYLSHYTYDAAGDRVLKRSGAIQQMLINDEQLVNFVELTDHTLYTNPYMTINDREYTKHYYIEGQRVCSKIGSGMLNNPIGLQYELALISSNFTDKRAEQETAIRKDAVCVGFNKDYLNLPPAFQYLQGLIKAFILTKDKSYKITKGK